MQTGTDSSDVQAAAAESDTRVLLVEDSLAERIRLAAMLERAGFAVTQAEHGLRALEILRHDPFNLIITDWQMPELDGLGLCQQARGELGLDGAYFIVLTGRNTRDDLIAAFEAGADDFLSKPVDRGELLVRLRAGQRVCGLRNRLAAQFAEAEQALARERAAKKLLDADIQAAGLLQQELLPDDHQVRGDVEIATLFQPATVLGGDMLNHFMIDDSWLGFFLLDVCGHGAASALQSFAISHSLTQLFEESGPAEELRPDELLAQLNLRFLDRAGSGRFFTIVLGMMEPATGRTRICQAAHPPPLIVSQDGSTHAVAGGGLPVGIFAESDYETTELELAPGDRLFLYSDGLTECTNSQREEFSDAALEDALTQTRTLPLPDSLAALEQSLHRWRGARAMDDDMSLLALHRIAPAER